MDGKLSSAESKIIGTTGMIECGTIVNLDGFCLKGNFSINGRKIANFCNNF
jgi:hypothetical protein